MSAPIIFSGASAKLLKPILDFFGNAQILSGTVDPSITATTAPKGSLYLNTSTGFTYRKLDAGSTTNWAVTATLQNFSTQLFNGTGAQTVYTLTTAPGSLNNTFVFISGVYQQKNTYTLAGTTVTFSTAPPAGTSNIEINYNSALPIGTPADNTVSTIKIQDSAVTTAKIADSNVTTAKLADGAVTQAKRAALGQQISINVTFNTSSTTLVDATNLTVTITTTGRPVFIGMIPGSTSGSNVQWSTNGTAGTSSGGAIEIQRDSTTVVNFSMNSTGASATFLGGTSTVSAFQTIDVPAAGTYVYKIQSRANAATGTFNISNAKLVAYEL